MTDSPDLSEPELSEPDLSGPGWAGESPLLLPAGVRERVLALASDRLGALPLAEVPVGLRAFARFTPARRARLAAAALAAALETDVAFRQGVAARLRAELPELAAAIEGGTALPAAPPEQVATAAYLLRPPAWRRQVAEAAGALSVGKGAAAGGDALAVRRLTEQLEALRKAGRAEGERLRAEVETARAEAVALRRRLREMGDRAGRAEAAQRAAETALADERVVLAEDRRRATEDGRKLQARLSEVEHTLAATRSAAKEGRNVDELRLRVLLDALLGAAGGLRRELALPPPSGRPVDAVAAEYAADRLAAPPAQGRDDDDPALLDALLAVPVTHLLVDGYNVSKTGYGAVTLEAQRSRLLSALGALAARTGAEVTVVFDGAEQVAALATTAPRGVRLLFSRAGETADEVLRRLVRAEPPGRPLLVVSSDREVADGVRLAGARPIPAKALVRLLGRT